MRARKYSKVANQYGKTAMVPTWAGGNQHGQSKSQSHVLIECCEVTLRLTTCSVVASSLTIDFTVIQTDDLHRLDPSRQESVSIRAFSIL